MEWWKMDARYATEKSYQCMTKIHVYAKYHACEWFCLTFGHYKNVLYNGAIDTALDSVVIL